MRTENRKARDREYAREYMRSARGKLVRKEYEQTLEGKLAAQRSCQKQRQKQREKVFGHYGIVCASCGFSDQRALSIDHIDGGGNVHRKAMKTGLGLRFYAWIIRNDFPEGFQTLCMNCQFIKRHEKQELKIRSSRIVVAEKRFPLFEHMED